MVNHNFTEFGTPTPWYFVLKQTEANKFLQERRREVAPRIWQISRLKHATQKIYIYIYERHFVSLGKVSWLQLTKAISYTIEHGSTYSSSVAESFSWKTVAKDFSTVYYLSSECQRVVTLRLWINRMTALLYTYTRGQEWCIYHTTSTFWHTVLDNEITFIDRELIVSQVLGKLVYRSY